MFLKQFFYLYFCLLKQNRLYANLAGGAGGALGAMVGAALIEVIRNSLLLVGVDPYWQGTFVGVFIILAVLAEQLRRLRSQR